MSKERTILIAGPTASGKSALALTLAERLGGTVINADSMQVYRELRILTARPTEDDEARAPHRLYGFVPAREAYSAARFARDAGAAISEARKAGRVPIVVGGTGLYFKALTDGLSPVPPIPEAVRAHWRAEADRVGAAGLHEVLKAHDPEMAARLRPTDPQRIVRALEVLDATGQSLAAWQAVPGAPVVAEGEALAFVVEIDRRRLAARVEDRLRRMLAEGALAEAEALAALGLSPELPVMRALGLRPLLELSEGSLTPEDALMRAAAETRQYAKRQETWLKSNMCSWTRISAQEMECESADIVDFIKSQP